MRFCKKPFHQMHIDPNGGCRLCAWTDINIGSLLEKDLEQVWNSENANKVRNAIKNGNYEYCRKTSCPFLENDSLENCSEEEVKNYKSSEVPTNYSVACDFTCNHSCPSCRNEIFKPTEEYVNNLNKIIDKLIPYLNRKETVKILTDGNGDCFASPYIMSMLERLSPENEKCIITFETNGACLDEAHWNRIKHLEKYHIIITITPNSFERTTFEYLNGGHKSYDALMRNLVFVKKLRDSNIINHLRISIVIQERNFWELPEFSRRCLEEFSADEVIAKPLYRWFMLSEEDYWFKDVLNPLHPYHREYLEMLKNPIFEDKRIFFWGARNLHPAVKHPAYVYKDRLKILEKLVSDASLKEDLHKKLQSMGINTVYLYGDTEITTAFCKILKEADIQVKGIMVRDIPKEHNYMDMLVKLCDYEVDNTDTFIVMNYNYIKQVTRDLHFKGFKGKILSLYELVSEA